MNTEQLYKDWITRIVEAMNAQDWEALDKLQDTYVTGEYIGHLPGASSLVRGPEGLKQYFRSVVGSMPGYRATIEDIFTIGDKGAARFRGRITDPATGKVQFATVLMISHLKEGKSVEDWEIAGEWEDEA